MQRILSNLGLLNNDGPEMEFHQRFVSHAMKELMLDNHQTEEKITEELENFCRIIENEQGYGKGSSLPINSYSVSNNSRPNLRLLFAAATANIISFIVLGESCKEDPEYQQILEDVSRISSSNAFWCQSTVQKMFRRCVINTVL